MDDKLECPYHGWQFNSDGKCVYIPYSDAPVPASAKAHTYHHTILEDLVLVWFDPDGEPPLWEINMHPDLCGKMVYHRMYQSEYNMHVCEMAENSPDY